MRTLIAGSHGMVGRNVVEILAAKGTAMKSADLKMGIDLRKAPMCEGAVKDCDRVFHLADQTSGIGYAARHHGQMLTDSLLISLNLLEAARKAGVKNYLYVSSSCVYPDIYLNEEVPEYYADSYIPEIANEGYGWAKRVAERQCRYYYLEHEMRTVMVRPANLFGPSYDWSRPLENMHVIPALITKMLRHDREIVVWGTGKQRRTFMYETEAAHLMVELMEYGTGGQAYNLGGKELSIRELVDLLQIACEYTGRILYDTSKLEGPGRKAQDTSKLSELGITPSQEAFPEQLLKTVEGAREAFRLSA